MKEIGGYIELDTQTGEMLHDDGIKLNCGRNALAYLIKTKKICKIYMPYFMCDSCDSVLSNNDVDVVYYRIGIDFKPIINNRNDGWLYVVNFYGQLSNEYLMSLGKNVIVDNAQAYFQVPIPSIDTIYTCRKYFGVADGAILYTDKLMEVIERDYSYNRMDFLLGRYEKSADQFYQKYVRNNQFFDKEPIKRMSKLTENLLHGIDYTMVKKKRTKNFTYLYEQLKELNKLNLMIPEGAFMYPLYIDNGVDIRKKLQKKRIYIPILWPSVTKRCSKNTLEYDMAQDILPLPVDQRYGVEEMEYIVRIIKELIQ